MKILYTVTLVAIFIKCVTASGDDMSLFREVVDEGEVDKAVKLYHSVSNYYDKQPNMLDYVIDTRDRGFIFKFARKAGIRKYDFFVALHRKKASAIIEEAIEILDFSQNELVEVASDPELMCSPGHLFNLLGKIEKQEDREDAIEGGVYWLFEGERPECIDPLLEALENNDSFRHLKDVLIRETFSVYACPISFMKRYYDHPAVTPKFYASGLINFGDEPTQVPIFSFLLNEADQDDLKAVKQCAWYENSSSDEFKGTIEKALLTAKPGGSRVNSRDPQRAKLAIETFDNDSSMRVPTLVSQLIASYLVDESILKPRTMPINQTIGVKRKKRDDSADESA